MKRKMTKVLSIFLCIMTCVAYSTPALAGTEAASKDETQVTEQQTTEKDDTTKNRGVAATNNSAKADASSSTAKEKTADADNDAETDSEESDSDLETLPQKGTDDNISWEIDENGVMTISGTGEMKEYESDTAPWNAYKAEITSVKFEEGITKIGMDSFNECTNLTEIDIPSSVTTISGYAFYHCTSLTTVNLPEKVASLGYATFGDCEKLKEVTFNNDDISIDDKTFLNITGHLTFKCNSDSNAWNYASSRSITKCCLRDHVWNSEYTVDKEATPFEEGEESIHCQNCDVKKDSKELPKTDSDGGKEDNITWTIDQTGLLTVTGEGELSDTYPWHDKGYDKYVTKVIIGTGITTIDYSISEHENLKVVELSDTVETIKEDAFYDCPNLQEITIPNDNVAIDDDIFSDCSSDLVIRCNPDSKACEYAKENDISWQCINHKYSETYTVDKESTPFEEGEESRHCVYCDSKTDARAVPKAEKDSGTDENISWTIDANGAMTISGTGDMKDYDGDTAPWNKYKKYITSVKFEEGITKIGKDTFNEECPNLTEIDIPSSVTTISGYAFYKCTALKTVNLPASVASLGYAAFGDCTSLETVTFNNDEIDISGSAFLNVVDNLTFICNPDSAAWEYASDYKISKRCITHTYGEYQIDTEATCEKAGSKHRICEKCQYKDVEVIPAGHKWTTYRKNAGYLQDGTTYSYCTVCKVKKDVKTLAGYSKYVVKKLKVKKGKKSFKVTWKKASKANRKVISGYQIRYSKKANMASSKYVKAGKSSKGKKIKKLSKKTKYYVQVRNYTKKGGKTYYSKWSGKKTVRTK